ncbi:MAG: LamG domain-containing protein, partial [Planctomycetota bacterium]
NFRVSASSNAARALQFIVRTSTNQLLAATYNFAAGEFTNFTHVAGTFDGQTIRLFKNGAQVATFAVPVVSEVQNNGGQLRLGNGDPVTPGNETWNGTIDEVRIWPMARTAGEIAAARDDELSGMPGGVLVFPLNGTYVGDGGSPIGTPFGTITFAPGTTALIPTMPLLLPLGQPTSTCPRSSEMLVGSAPKLGNSNFTLWCVRGAKPANSPASVAFAANSAAPASQPPILGVNVAFDIFTIAASLVLTPASNALGNSNVVLPIPSQASLIGQGWVIQFAYLDTMCGPQGISASNGLLFAIQ